MILDFYLLRSAGSRARVLGSLAPPPGEGEISRIKLSDDRAWVLYTYIHIYPFETINQRKSYIIRRDANQFESRLVAYRKRGTSRYAFMESVPQIRVETATFSLHNYRRSTDSSLFRNSGLSMISKGEGKETSIANNNLTIVPCSRRVFQTLHTYYIVFVKQRAK